MKKKIILIQLILQLVTSVHAQKYPYFDKTFNPYSTESLLHLNAQKPLVQSLDFLTCGLVPGRTQANKYGRKPKGKMIYVTEHGYILDTIQITSNGGLNGKITDTKLKPIDMATIRVQDHETLVAASITDATGCYKIYSLKEGNYRMKISYTGKQDSLYTLIVLPGNEPTTIDFTLTNSLYRHKDIVRCGPVVPKNARIDPYINNNILLHRFVQYSPTTNITDLLTFSPHIYQNHATATLSSDGGRTTGNLYIIDGMIALTGQ